MMPAKHKFVRKRRTARSMTGLTTVQPGVPCSDVPLHNLSLDQLEGVVNLNICGVMDAFDDALEHSDDKINAVFGESAMDVAFFGR